MAGCQSAAAGPHSLLVQLSALHRLRIQVDVAVLVLALAKVIAHFTTGSVFQLVPVAAIGLFTSDVRRWRRRDAGRGAGGGGRDRGGPGCVRLATATQW